MRLPIEMVGISEVTDINTTMGSELSGINDDLATSSVSEPGQCTEGRDVAGDVRATAHRK